MPLLIAASGLRIVAQHRDELLAQRGGGALAREILVRLVVICFDLELETEQCREGFEHGLGLVIERNRPRIEGAQVSDVALVLQEDRHRDVALERVHLRRRVLADGALRTSLHSVVSTASSPPGWRPKPS